MRTGGSGLRYYHRSQQYSITALNDSTGSVKERYSYDAYGTPTIADANGVVRFTSAENNRYTCTGREWDESLEAYHFRARIYLPALGRFGSRDPIGYSGGMNAYQFVASNPMYFTDPSGLLPCLCKCDPGQQPANAIVNDAVNQTLAFGVLQHLLDLFTNGTNETVLDILEEDFIGSGSPLQTGIEQSIIQEATNAGVIKDCKKGLSSVGVVVLNCRGKTFCVGTDKFGHFFEEGLAYYEIVQHGLGLEHAIAWGELTEGVLQVDTCNWDILNSLHSEIGNIEIFLAFGGPTKKPFKDWFGLFGDKHPLWGTPIDPNGIVSPADLAANLAGFHFINDFLNGDKQTPFDICDHVNGSWDHVAPDGTGTTNILGNK